MEDLGRAVGISAQAVSRWECGGAPDVALLPGLADALGVNIDALFGLEGGEKINIEDAVRQRMLTIPKERRLDWLCQLVWSAAGALVADRMEDVPNFSSYVNHCQMSSWVMPNAFLNLAICSPSKLLFIALPPCLKL